MKYLLLFAPFVFAYLTQDWPSISYAISWSGSIFILWATLTGRIKPLPPDRPLLYQIFRPLFFTQVIFVAYTCLTSLFFFISNSSVRVVQLAAEAQSYYVLGHAALATGMLLLMDYRDSGRYSLVWHLGANRLLIGLSATFLLLTLAFSLDARLLQVTIRVSQLAMVASVFSLGLSLIYREKTHIALTVPIFLANFVLALMSGWKEQVVVLLLLFFGTIFPYYRRATAAVATVSLILFIAIMPTYNSVFRNLAWAERVSPEEAMKTAIAMLRRGDVDIVPATREFLTVRISEINLFVRYLENIPERRPFYGTQILEQTGQSMIPRVLWPEKPNTERLVMERVYENGVVSRASPISAKPQYVVDSYLLNGIPGIIFFCGLYGALASGISRLAERWFGGYTMGSGLVCASLFQILWRGNTFEFFFPMVLWSFLLMTGLFAVGVLTRVLVKDGAPSPAVDPRAHAQMDVHRNWPAVRRLRAAGR